MFFDWICFFEVCIVLAKVVRIVCFCFLKIILFTSTLLLINTDSTLQLAL